jgi:hypothetical protein
MGCKRGAAPAGAALAILEMALTFTIRLFAGEWHKILTAIARVNCLHREAKTGGATHKGSK